MWHAKLQISADQRRPPSTKTNWILITLTVFCSIALVAAIYLRWNREMYTSSIDHFSPMDLDDLERKRFQIYSHGLEHGQVIQITATDPDIHEIISFDTKHKFFFERHDGLLRRHQNSETVYDLKEIHRRFMVDSRKLVKIATWADSITWHKRPTLAKARHREAQSLQKPYCGLLRLRSRMHFAPIQHDSIPFDQKKNIVLWRGGPSGPGFENQYEPEFLKPSREDCLRRWCRNPATQHEIDVGLTKKWRYQKYQQYVKNDMTIKKMMEYKYLLSIEGNDVATNLKWIMASNSVVLMPKPRVESWFAESLLEPYVHYVPVKDDFSDILHQKLWCDQHPEKCKKIVKRAQAFVQPFRNEERDYYLSFRVLQYYMSKVEIEIVDDKKVAVDEKKRGKDK